MEQEFEVMLTNRRKLLLAFVGGLLLLVVASVAVLNLLSGHVSSNLVKAVLMGTFLGGIGALVWLVRSVSTEPTRITIGADKMTVLNRKSGRERQVFYDNVSGHRFRAFNGAEQLDCTLRDGGQLTLAINPNFHRGQDLHRPAQALEAARRLHQQAKTPPA